MPEPDEQAAAAAAAAGAQAQGGARESRLAQALGRALNAIANLLRGTDPSLMRVDAGAIGALLDPITPILSAEALAAARAEILAMGLPSAELRGALTMIDPLVQAVAERAAGRLVIGVTDEVRQAINDVTQRAVSGEITWSQAAAEIRTRIGLLPRWATAVRKGQADAYERAIRSGVSPARAAQLAQQHADRHAARLLKARAENIARTEIMRAQNMGRYAGWVQMQQAGLVPLTAQKKWVTAPDGTRRGGPCPVCRPLNGQTVDLNASFGNGVLMPPAHPSCRCTAVLVTRPRN